MTFDDDDRRVREVCKDLLHQQEKIFLDQLDSLVRDNVLTIVKGEHVVVQDPIANSLKLQQTVHFTFKAEKVLEEYRKKVDSLTKELNAIRKIVKAE